MAILQKNRFFVGSPVGWSCSSCVLGLQADLPGVRRRLVMCSGLGFMLLPQAAWPGRLSLHKTCLRCKALPMGGIWRWYS